MTEPSYSSGEVCALAGVTYRQLDYWTRHGLVRPSIAAGIGSGSHRRWSPGDVDTVRRVAAAAQIRATPLCEMVA